MSAVDRATRGARPAVAGSGTAASPRTALDAPRNRVRPIGLFVIALLLGLVVDAVAGLSRLLPPGVSAAAGLPVIGCGGALFMWCLGRFERARTGLMPDQPSRRLVVAGPYRWSRNPQFVGLALIASGLALLLGSTGAMVLMPIAVLIADRTVVRCEEAYLRRRFGAAYNRYAARVPRWLGRSGLPDGTRETTRRGEIEVN